MTERKTLTAIEKVLLRHARDVGFDRAVEILRQEAARKRLETGDHARRDMTAALEAQYVVKG